MRFEKGQLPPADAFWSLTIYDAEFFSSPTRSIVTTLVGATAWSANLTGR